MKKTRLKRISKKRQESMKLYKVLREEYLADNPTCEVCNSRTANEIHHREPGRGSKTNDVSLFVAICRKCHRRIHQGEQINGEYKFGPKWARQEGWLI